MLRVRFEKISSFFKLSCEDFKVVTEFLFFFSFKLFRFNRVGLTHTHLQHLKVHLVGLVCGSYVWMSRLNDGEEALYKV